MHSNGYEPPPEPITPLPANPMAERAVLGGLLIEPDQFERIEYLTESDFFVGRNARVFEAMRALYRRNVPIDLVTLTDELQRVGGLEEIGGSMLLMDLVSETPTALYVTHYAAIVRRFSVYRRLVAGAGEIARLAMGGENYDVSEVMRRAEGILQDVFHNSLMADGVVEPLDDILHQTIEHWSALAANPDRARGLTTGFHHLDNLLGGLQRTDLIILAGRPGMGKSSLGLSIALNAVLRQYARVLIFSLEMSKRQVAARLLSMFSGLDSHRLQINQVRENEWQPILEACQSLSQCKIWVDDTAGLPVSELRARARRLVALEGLDLIVVDYLQLMSGESAGHGREVNRQQEISYISRMLKGLARELNVPILALSQLNRSVESRADKKPVMSDLRESGSLEQDSDVVMFVHRDDYYNDETEEPNVAEVIISKHRHGPTGTVKLFFHKETTRFNNLEIERTDLVY